MYSAVSKSYANFKVGDTVNLQLMCRPKNSLQVFKMSTGSLPSSSVGTEFPHLFGNSDAQMYSKLILADPNEVGLIYVEYMNFYKRFCQILSIIDRERNELKCQLSADGDDCPESMFIQQALDLLQERQLIVEELATKFDQKHMFKPKAVQPLVDEAANVLGASLRITAKEFIPTSLMRSDDTSEPNDRLNFVIDEESHLMLHDIEIQPTANCDAQHFFFYQSSDGQLLYMHSVNIRMLQQEYGSLDRAPQMIRGEIIQKESCSMTDALRKRLKYLQHLPVASQFEVVEIKLDESYLSNEVFEIFRGIFSL